LLTFRAKKNKAITLNEMANLLIELGARDGIAGEALVISSNILKIESAGDQYLALRRSVGRLKVGLV